MTQICRTCFQETAERNYIELEHDHQSVDIKGKIEFCIPEMDLSLTSKPVVCIMCVNLLNSAFTFKKQCLDTEHSIKKFMFGLEGLKGSLELKDIYLYKSQKVDNAVPRISLVGNDTVMETTPVIEHTAVVDDLNNLLDDALNVQILPESSIDIIQHDIIKIEVDDDEDDVIFLEENLLIRKETEDELQSESSFETSGHKTLNSSTLNNFNKVTRKKRRGRPPRLSNSPIPFQSSSNGESTTPLHCEYCDFTSKNVEILLTHVTCHKDKLQGACKPYFCPLCKLRSKWKFSIINHMKIHNIYITPRNHTNGEKKKAKCEKCPFVTRSSTKWKKLLDEHVCLQSPNATAAAKIDY